jgi:predicted DsbA family dithiol-disulfide isomerase
MAFRPHLALLSKKAMTVFDVQITSDVVCPWCYIGHTRLSKAIAAHQKSYPDDQFKLHYVPYYLQPPTEPNPPPFPVTSKPRRQVYAEKFGPQRAKQIEEMMSEVSKGEGLNFKFGGNTGSSRNGHRLIYFAQSHGGEKSQNDTMLGLWKRYYEQEIDITQLDVLVDVGVEAGLGSREEIKEYLESGKDGEKVDQLAEEQRQNGITGVPNYVFQNKWQVSGGQEPSVFESIFKRWKDQEAKGQL